MITASLRSLWAQPRPTDVPARVWRDWLLVAAVILATVLETTLRSDVLWRPAAAALTLTLVWTLLWRRTHPLLMLAVAFIPLALTSVIVLVADTGPFGLNAMAFILFLPYALVRWGSGREVLLGLPLVVATYLLGILADHTSVGDAIAGFAFGCSPMLLAALVRLQHRSHTQEKEQVKLHEREQLARDLHDTVAHHVSAIAVRAQAGQFVAASDPQQAVESLRIIEEEATRALTEMRVMVGALRRTDDVDLAPQRTIADLVQLSRNDHRPVVTVDLGDGFDDVGPAVGAACFRIGQEAVTNALRHGRNATTVNVRVETDGTMIRLTVTDDGDGGAGSPAREGYGLLGMKERAVLLGGTFEAGPTPAGGWRVTALLPQTGGVE